MGRARFVRSLVVLGFLLWCAPASAGRISIAWDPVDDPTVVAYRVFRGTAPGNYTSHVDVSRGTSLTMIRLQNCATHYIAVKAIDENGRLSAQFSNEISGYPAPALFASDPPVVERGTRASLVLSGANFAEGVAVRFRDPSISVESAVMESCNQIRVTIAVGSDAAVGPTGIEVENSDQTVGTYTHVLTVVPEVPLFFVTGAIPPDGAEDVPVDARPWLAFSAPVDPGTVARGTIELLDSAGGAVEQAAGSPALSADGRSVTVIPAGPLAHETEFRLRVLGGPAGVRGLDGATMGADFEWVSRFTTEAEPGTAPLVETVSPAGGSTGVPVSARPSVTFTEIMDPATIDAARVALLDGDGLERPQADGSPVLSDDGRTATIVPDAELEFNRAYRVQVLGGEDGVADRVGRTMQRTFVQIPGFMTAAGPSEAPIVVEVDPADGSVNALVTVEPSVRFSAPLRASTVTAGTVKLIDSEGDAVEQGAGSPELSSDGITVTLAPAARLAFSSSYRVQVVGGEEGVQGRSGSALGETFTQPLGFKTQADPAGAPRVVSVEPHSLATGVPREIQPLVAFSEPMERSSITSSSIILMDPNGGAVRQAPGSPFLSDDGFTATIVPFGPLAYSTSYRVRVIGGMNGVRDADRNSLTATYTQASGFTILDDEVAPVISEVRSIPQATSAVIGWNTDEPASGRVFYRRIDAESDQRPVAHATRVLGHSVRIEGLAPSTSYVFRVESTDAAGQVAVSEEQTLTTEASPYFYLSVEAEVASLLVPVRAAYGAGAFAGGWIDTPPFTPMGSQTSPSGRASASFYAPTGGTWYVWVRLFGISGANDSWFESIDGASRRPIAPPIASSWEWVLSRSYNLTAGLHVLELGGLEAKAQADRVLVTNDPAFVATEQPDLDVTPPAAPQGLIALADGDDVTLEWTNPPDDVSTIVVRYRTDGRYPQSPVDGFPVGASTAVAGETDSITHTGLSVGTTYRYAVFAVDRAGNASGPAEVRVTP